MSFKKSFLKNIISLGGYNYGSQIANFLSSIVLSRLLLPEEYGYVALITVFTGFVVYIADPGLSLAIIRSDYGKTFQNSVSNLSVYFGIILFLLMVALAYPIAYFYNDASLVLPIIVLSVIFIIGAFRIVPMAIISKKLDFKYIGKVRFIANLVSIFFMILLAFLGFSYWSLIIPQIILYLVLYILFEKKAKIGFKFCKLKYSIVAFRKTKSLIKNISGFNIIDYWARKADNIIIGKYYGNYDLGIYNRAYRMLQLSLSLITGLFGTVLYPSLKQLKSEGGNINNEYKSILGVISIAVFPIAAVLILIPNLFVKVLWGEDWIQVAEILPYFGILIIFETLIKTTKNIYILLEKEKTFMYIGVLSALFILFAIIIGSLYSIKAIVISYCLCYLIIIVPLHLYIGFIKTFGYSYSFIIKFWLPKITIGLLLFVSIWLEKELWLIGLIIIMLIHILYYQRNELLQLKSLILTKMKNRK